MCAGGTQAPARAEAGAHCGWLGSTRRRGRHPWPAGDAHGAAQPAAVTRVSAVVGARAAASCHKVGGAGAHVLGRSQYLHARSRSREPTPRAARSILRRAADTQQRRLHSHMRVLERLLLGLSKFLGHAASWRRAEWLGLAGGGTWTPTFAKGARVCVQSLHSQWKGLLKISHATLHRMGATRAPSHTQCRTGDWSLTQPSGA